MPTPYTPPGSSTSYDVPADLDAVDVGVWFEDFADTVDAALALKLAAAPAKNTQTADFDFALTDAAGLLVVANKATALAGTLKQNSAMASSWPADSIIRFINRNDGVLTITAGSGVTLIGTALTFAKGKGGALVWVAANTWVCVPFSSGSAGPTVSGTTGSPTTGTGKDGKTLYTWTGNGSFTLSTAGRVRLLCVGGGQGGSASIATAGYGGSFDDVEVDLPAGTYTVVVGAAGTYPSGAGGESSVYLSGGFYLLAKYVGGANLGNGGRSPDATGRYSDISGSSVGYAGAGYNSTNPGTYDVAYGGCPNSATVARANSGGGGSQAGSTGLGAAGRVELLV
jgi:hypothetical protein